MTIKDISEMIDLFYAIKHMHERLLRAEKRIEKREQIHRSR